jgi:hypothetical protein
MVKTKKEPSPQSQCWCKDRPEGYPHPKHPTPRKRKPTDFSALIDDLIRLRDGENDELGKLLGRAVKALEQAAKTPPAPKGYPPSPSTIIVCTMESEHFSWLTVGRTEDEAREALKARWNKHIHEYGGAGYWDRFAELDGHGSNPADWYGARFQKVVFGKGYVDGEDETGGP